MVKVNYASLQTQSSTMSSASQSRVAGFNQLISAFDSFGGSGDELIGSGYDAARVYATSIMSPYYKGFILYSEAVADAANTLADNYVAKCGAENLDEEQLQAEIDSLSRGCMSLSASISGLQSKTKPAEGDAARISRLQEQLTAAQSQLTTVQEKLANLRAFSAESLLACTSADTYQLLISQAMSGVSASFGGGGFTLPEDLSWVSDVEQGWADREIALENNYLSALEKVKNGESLTEAELTAIERYAAAYPDSVDASVLKYVQEARQVKAEEMKIRGLIDKVDAGKSLTDEETKTLQDYQSNHPDSNLLEHVKHALGQNESKKKEEETASNDLIDKTIESYNNGDISEVDVANILRLLKENGFDVEGSMKLIQEFGKESLSSWLQDKASKDFANYITSFILPGSPLLAQQLKNYIGKTLIKVGTSALLSTSPGSTANQVISKGIDIVSDFAVPAANSLDDLGRAGSALVSNSQFTKYLPYGIGAAIDFGAQVFQGKPVGEAAIKTAAHTAINIALMGATGPLGFVVGVFGSMAFDAIYDNREAIGKWIGDAASSISDKANEIFDKAGDAVGGFFKGLGSAFG